jgi:hypothetical protein
MAAPGLDSVVERRRLSCSPPSPIKINNLAAPVGRFVHHYCEPKSDALLHCSRVPPTRLDLASR